jgi:DNA-binding SARP family transcriptional activator/predicted Zn-dependent protease
VPDNASPVPVAPPATIRFRALGTLDLQRPGTGEVRALLVQPKRLALFAYLLLARPQRLHRRDSLLALFWPESTEEQARRSLRQALHFLRQSLGADVIASRGDEEVGVAPHAVWCDVREFDRALDDGRAEEALALYRGPMLDGFHVAGASPDLCQWIESERARVHARAVEAAAALADRAEREGNAALAIQRLRDLLRLDPSAEAALRRLMTLLDRAGDRAGALRAYDELARRLASEVGADPSPASVALAERVRAGRTSGAQAAAALPAPPAQTRAPPSPRSRPTPPYIPVPTSIPPRALATPAVAPPPARRRARWRVPLALVAVAVVGGVGVARWIGTRGAAPSAPLVLAVGAIDDRGSGDSSGAAVLRDLLATDLARVPGVAVVSQARMQELLLRARDDTGHAAVMRSAAAAGAQEVLEGELYRRSPDAMRLDVRRIDVASGTTRGAYSVEGPDLFVLVERASDAIATELGQRVPAPGLARAATPSLAAWRLYGEGRRAAYIGDLPGSLRLFEAALAEDSSFAMAAFWAARIAGAIDGGRQLELLAQATRAARRAPAIDRLRIRLAWAIATNDPATTALADSLARLEPNDVEVLLNRGEMLLTAGEFARALPVLHDVIARDTVDSGARAHDEIMCTACLAFSDLAYAYTSLDSAAGAERVSRAWTRLQPRSPTAWANLAVTLAVLGRTADAEHAWERWRSVAPPEADLRQERAQIALRRGEFAEADPLLAGLARDGSTDLRAESYWWQVISFRMQGRLDAALRAALRFRDASSNGSGALPQAQVLLESGRPLESARMFEAFGYRSIADVRARLPAGAPDSTPGRQARALSWPLTHAAAGYAAVGDTTRLAVLADSIELLGRREALGRDRLLHHHVRGLLWKARGRPEEAIAELRRAMVSPTLGYTRTNLELGRLLTAAGRPREAVAVLAPALRGDLQASNYYVTHTELHEALAQAWDAAGNADSARVHWRWVANAWRAGDAPFRERAARARRRAESR